jgi:hypothetical protein
MGCSVLSIVEIFYAFFAWCFKHDKNKKKIHVNQQNFDYQQTNHIFVVQSYKKPKMFYEA